MCGRYTLTSDKNTFLTHFGLSDVPDFRYSYNIAPSQEVPVVRFTDEGWELINCHWGLIPHWAKEAKFKPINARAESMADKPFFRDCFRKRRCLIPANGFYEWKKEGNHIQPYFIYLKDQELFAFAGLWDRWKDKDTCIIITTGANDMMKPIHDRMPVILSSEDYDQWLEEGGEGLLQPCQLEMDAYPIGTQVNSPRNQGSCRNLSNRLVTHRGDIQVHIHRLISCL